MSAARLASLRTRRDNLEAEYAEQKAEVELWYANQTDALTAALWNLLDDVPVVVVVEAAPVDDTDKLRQPRNAESRLAALGYDATDFAGFTVADMHRILSGKTPKAAPAAVTASDLGWTSEQLDSLRPGEAALIVTELRTAEEWRIAPNLTLVRKGGE